MTSSCRTIRSASVNDIPEILAVERQSPLAAHWTSDQYSKLVVSGMVLVAEDSGKLCGFVAANAIAGEWEIENVVVANEFLRQGVASQLLCELIQRAKTAPASASTLLLEVRESNLPARRLYEKHGFAEECRRHAYYRNPTEDALLYALRFTR